MRVRRCQLDSNRGDPLDSKGVRTSGMAEATYLRAALGCPVCSNPFHSAALEIANIALPSSAMDSLTVPGRLPSLLHVAPASVECRTPIQTDLQSRGSTARGLGQHDDSPGHCRRVHVRPLSSLRKRTVGGCSTL